MNGDVCSVAFVYEWLKRKSKMLLVVTKQPAKCLANAFSFCCRFEFELIMQTSVLFVQLPLIKNQIKKK